MWGSNSYIYYKVKSIYNDWDGSIIPSFGETLY